MRVHFPVLLMDGMRIPCYHFTIERRLMAIDKYKPVTHVRRVKRWKQYTNMISYGIICRQYNDREIQK